MRQSCERHRITHTPKKTHPNQNSFSYFDWIEQKKTRKKSLPCSICRKQFPIGPKKSEDLKIFVLKENAFFHAFKEIKYFEFSAVFRMCLWIHQDKSNAKNRQSKIRGTRTTRKLLTPSPPPWGFEHWTKWNFFFYTWAASTFSSSSLTWSSIHLLFSPVLQIERKHTGNGNFHSKGSWWWCKGDVELPFQKLIFFLSSGLCCFKMSFRGAACFQNHFQIKFQTKFQKCRKKNFQSRAILWKNKIHT